MDKLQIIKDTRTLDREFPFEIFHYQAVPFTGEGEAYHWHEFMRDYLHSFRKRNLLCEREHLPGGGRGYDYF